MTYLGEYWNFNVKLGNSEQRHALDIPIDLDHGYPKQLCRGVTLKTSILPWTYNFNEALINLKWNRITENLCQLKIIGYAAFEVNDLHFAETSTPYWFGVWFCAFEAHELVNFNYFIPNRAPTTDKTVHSISHRAKCQFFCLQSQHSSPNQCGEACVNTWTSDTLTLISIWRRFVWCIVMF